MALQLGHMRKKEIQVLLKKDKLTGLKSLDVGLCEDCIFEK